LREYFTYFPLLPSALAITWHIKDIDRATFSFRGTAQCAANPPPAATAPPEVPEHHEIEAAKVVDVDTENVNNIEPEDVEAKKCQVLQAKTRRLAGRLYPEKGTSVFGTPYSYHF
jgi:hypothetical protein